MQIPGYRHREAIGEEVLQHLLVWIPSHLGSKRSKGPWFVPHPFQVISLKHKQGICSCKDNTMDGEGGKQ